MDEGLRTFKDNVCGTIRTIDAGGDKRVIEQNENNNVGYRIRKLTPRECFRLMAFSDEAFDRARDAGVSNTQLYKQAGNSIVVDVLYYIYKNLYKAMPYLFDNLKVSSFFSGIGAFECALDKLFDDINGATNGEESFIISDIPLTHDCAGGSSRIEVLGNYMKSNHDASRIVSSSGCAPCVKENHGTVTATLVSDNKPGTIVYDDYNSNIRKDQDTIGTLTLNIGSSSLRKAYKLIEKDG